MIKVYLRDREIKASICRTMSQTKNSTTGPRHLTLVLPGLHAGGERGEQELSLARLEWLLGRADQQPGSRSETLDECLFWLFRAEVPSGKDLPVAAVTRVLDVGIIDNAWWLRADPVHLQPRGDTLVMAASDSLNIRQAEADQLVREILGVFTEDGWVLKAPKPDRWYLQPVPTPDVKTTHIDLVRGENIYPALPSGADGKKWHTILNELQILLHTSAVNIEREARGEPPINSLWFWGGGRLPVVKESDWARFWGDQTVGLALARLAQIPHSKRPATAGQWLAEAEAGAHLVVLDQAQQAQHQGHFEAWRDFVAQLESQWIEPLIHALDRGQLQELTLIMDNCRQFTIKSKHLRRWWRRRRNLSGYK